MGSVPAKQQCNIHRFLLGAVLLCLLIFSGGPLPARGATHPDPEEEDVSSYTIKVRRLQKVISRQEDKIEEAKIEERNILEELEGLEIRLARQQEKLESLTAQMARQQELIAQQEEELKVIRVAKDGVQNHLIRRINAYYTMGNIGLFNVTFSTKSLPELLSFYDAFDTLLQYDQDLLKTYQTSLKQVGRVKKALDLEKTVLEDFIHQTAAEKAQLEKTRQEKNSLLSRIRVQATLHQRAMDEMLQTSEELSASIQDMKSKDQLGQNRFLADKGRLPPPVDGKLLTLFQQEKTDKFGIRQKSKGIELKAADGAKIIAVHDGEVIFAGYLRGYGNTIIIHHGFQYYTVTSRVENIQVAKGQKVNKGTVIGTVGAAATLFDEGLYFEVRHGRQSLDPLAWLNRGRLAGKVRGAKGK